MGSIGQNSHFSKHGHVEYQIKWNHEMQQHGNKYLASRPPIGRNIFVSEHGHVAYQIKGNHEFSNMVSTILHADASPLPPNTHTTLGVESIGQNSTFSKHGQDAYQIKGIHKCSNLVANI